MNFGLSSELIFHCDLWQFVSVRWRFLCPVALLFSRSLCVSVLRCGLRKARLAPPARTPVCSQALQRELSVACAEFQPLVLASQDLCFPLTSPWGYWLGLYPPRGQACKQMKVRSVLNTDGPDCSLSRSILFLWS